MACVKCPLKGAARKAAVIIVAHVLQEAKGSRSGRNHPAGAFPSVHGHTTPGADSHASQACKKNPFPR